MAKQKSKRKQKRKPPKSTDKLSQTYYSRLKYGAARRGLEWDVEKEYLQQLFDEQNGLCALTHLPLILVQNHTKDYKEQNATLDRKDSKIGYVRGNVRWVIKWVNVLKWDLTENELIEFCRNVVVVHDYMKITRKV